MQMNNGSQLLGVVAVSIPSKHLIDAVPRYRVCFHFLTVTSYIGRDCGGGGLVVLRDREFGHSMLTSSSANQLLI